MPYNVDYQKRFEAIEPKGLAYEIYPDLTWLPSDASFNWVEIALHAEVGEYLPPDHPWSRKLHSALMSVADLLIQKLPTRAPCMVELSASYYTLHPPASRDFMRTRLFRSLSVVFSSVGPYKHLDELPFLPALQTQLDLLKISRLEADRGETKRNSEKALNDSTNSGY